MSVKLTSGAHRDVLTTDVIDGYWGVLYLMQGLSTPLFCQMEVTMSQLKSLLTIASEGEVTVGFVAQSLGIGQPAASTVVDRLVQLGWADRKEDPTDRRRTLVRLTAEGQLFVDKIWRMRRDVLQGWLDALSTDDLKALARGIAALNAIASTGNENKMPSLAGS